MKLKRILTILATTMAFSTTIFGAISVNASKWHKGNPPIVRSHKWISGFKKVSKAERSSNLYYTRNYAPYMDKNNGFFTVSLLYDKNKKLVTNGSSTNHPNPYYRKVGKNLYEGINGSLKKGHKALKEELKNKKKYGTYYLFKIHNKHKISAWIYEKDENGKETRHLLGKFHSTNYSFN